MKVLFLTGDYPNSTNPYASIFTHNQVKALKAAGVEVAVLVTDMRSVRKKRKLGYSKYTFDGVTVYQYAIPCGPIPYLHEKLSIIAAMRGFRNVIKEFGVPDVLHAHFTLAGYCANAIKNKYHLPYVLTEHSSGIDILKMNKRNLKTAQIAYNHANCLIGVSSALKSKMQPLTNQNISVIPNIIAPYFKICEVNKNNSFTFITVCRLISGKRVDLILHALQKLLIIYPDVQLKIVGTGPMLTQLQEICSSLNIQSAVDFLGVCQNDSLPLIYNQCHCFVLPSQSETFGVVYAEAAACGLPLIATNCGGPADIIDDENGLLITIDHAEELYNAMKYVYENINQFDAQQISTATITKFGGRHISENLIRIYNEVVNE